MQLCSWFPLCLKGCPVLLLQSQYKKLQDSSKVPETLFTDLVRIARLAKVGQSNLYNTIKQSCSVSGSSTSNFTPYVKALDLLVSFYQSFLMSRMTHSLSELLQYVLRNEVQPQQSMLSIDNVHLSCYRWSLHL
jgi:hypothetical protein